MVGLVAAAAGLGGLGTIAYGIAGRSAQIFGPSVYRGAGKRRSIALTFDDGPSEGTLRLLDYLGSEEIKATFFQCGMNVARHPDIARRVHKAGHEIGNHSFSHPRLAPSLSQRPRVKSAAFISKEFESAQHMIASETGVTPTLLRAPYGLRWYGMGRVQKRLGLLGVMWTVIGHDWEWNSEAIARLVLRKAAPGGIVCLHDGRDIQPSPDVSEMLKAVRQIVPELKNQGYKFETVTQLLKSDAEVNV